jgi:hypothetical protein
VRLAGQDGLAARFRSRTRQGQRRGAAGGRYVAVSFCACGPGERPSSGQPASPCAAPCPQPRRQGRLGAPGLALRCAMPPTPATRPARGRLSRICVPSRPHTGRERTQKQCTWAVLRRRRGNHLYRAHPPSCLLGRAGYGPLDEVLRSAAAPLRHHRPSLRRSVEQRRRAGRAPPCLLVGVARGRSSGPLELARP